MRVEIEKGMELLYQDALPNELVREISRVNIDNAKAALMDLKSQQFQLALKAVEVNGDSQVAGQALDQDQEKNEDDNENGGDKSHVLGQDNQANQQAQPNENTQKENNQEKPKPNDESTAQETEHLNLDDVSIVAHLSESLKLLLLGGHDSNLTWVSNGLPYEVLRVPRNFEIGHEFSPVLTHIFPLIPPPPPPENIITSGPCCSDPLDIQVTQDSSSYFSPTEISNISSILDSSFKFTFEYFCNSNTGQIIFTQAGGGVYGEAGGSIEANDDYSPESYIINIIQDDDSCCPPVNCDNPITTISVELLSYYVDFYSINSFVYNTAEGSGANVTFLDSTGHEWGLFYQSYDDSNQYTYSLRCIEQCDCSCEENVPINFNSNGSEIITSEFSSAFNTVVNNFFNFTFSYDCDSREASLLFNQTGIVGASYDEGSQGYFSVGIDLFSLPIDIIQPDGTTDDCTPLSCDNQLVSLNMNLVDSVEYPIGFQFNSLDDFLSNNNNPYYSSIYFVDEMGDHWSLISTPSNGDVPFYSLVCEDLSTATAPLVFDLNHNGVEISALKDSNVVLNIDGVDKNVAWVGAGDGILTYNYSGEGPIENKNFILTDNVQGVQTDLQALQVLADQKGGILDFSNPIWDKLGMWQDANQNGKMDSGEYHTLNELKIASINLSGDGDVHYLNGNVIANNVSFTYQDGTQGVAADAILKTQDVVQNNQTVPADISPNLSAASAPVTAAVAPVEPLHVDSTVQSAIEQQQVVNTG